MRFGLLKKGYLLTGAEGGGREGGRSREGIVMEVTLQLLEKGDSIAAPEKSMTFWSKEALLKRCSQEAQAERKQQVPPFCFGIAMLLYHLLLTETNS